MSDNATPTTHPAEPEALPAPPALFYSLDERPAAQIVDADGQVLFTFDEKVTLPMGIAAVDLMNIVLRKPEVMHWVAYIGRSFENPDGIGYEPGNFYTHIVKAAFGGDPAHQAMLAESFPEVVAAVRIWQNIYGSPDLFVAAIQGNWVLA